LKAYDGRSATRATVEPSARKTVRSGSEMLDGRWAGFGYATSTVAPIWPEGCREGYHIEI
jgi:hypothetical protein